MKTLLSLFLLSCLLLTGCETHTGKPATHVYTLPGGVQATLGTTDNSKGSNTVLEAKYDPSTGALLQIKAESRDKGWQLVQLPDFTGENWTMYAGIGIAVLGVGMFFFPLTAPLAGWVIAGGIGLVALGSWLKSDMAPWVTGGVIVAGLAYAFYRNRKALRNAVQGIEKSGSSEAKQAVYRNTDHSDDKLIKGLV